MGWFLGRLLRPLIWLVWVFGSTLRLFWLLLGSLVVLIRSATSWIGEIRDLRETAKTVVAKVDQASEAQRASNPLDGSRKTIFLLITCGQAVRNFLLSDVLALLCERYNVVILTPYASDEAFRRRFARPGVHVIPWFESFRSNLERFFLYYLMSETGSATHENWLKNLEERARVKSERRARYMQHAIVRRLSTATGWVVGRNGMLSLYHAYFLAYLPRSLFSNLFKDYRPSLVISTTAHHIEAWPLTSMARRYGAMSLANVLSWDNTSTKAALDPYCDHYTVWSPEMAAEIARFFPYIKSKIAITGSPQFDLYYSKRGELDRTTFLTGLGLSPDRPYILYTTNTPAGMPDEHIIVAAYWGALQKTELANQISLVVRLHPKEDKSKYANLLGVPNVAVTLAGQPYWGSSDRWLPTDQDMQLLLNSMRHAAVSVNVASTMSLESFTLELPTINVAFKSSPDMKDHSLMWSFSMYHTSEHYKAIVENGAVDLARSMDELVGFTRDALRHGARRKAEMHRTLEQKAGYCDGLAARRFCEVVEGVLDPVKAIAAPDGARTDKTANGSGVAPIPNAAPAE